MVSTKQRQWQELCQIQVTMVVMWSYLLWKVVQSVVPQQVLELVGGDYQSLARTKRTMKEERCHEERFWYSPSIKGSTVTHDSIVLYWTNKRALFNWLCPRIDTFIAAVMPQLCIRVIIIFARALALFPKSTWASAGNFRFVCFTQPLCACLHARLHARRSILPSNPPGRK